MRRVSTSLGFVAGLLITLLFAFAMFFVLITGAKFYQSIATVLEEQFKERTCLNYIVANVRHYDAAGRVSLADFHGVDALVMEEVLEGQVYHNMIYFHAGRLYELYAPADSQFELGDGFQLLEVDALRFERLTPALYRVVCNYKGRTADLLFYVSSPQV